MSGALPRRQDGPISYPVAALVKGGQLVVPDSGDNTKVNVAGAGAFNVLGVAGTDAAPIPDQSSGTDSLAGGAPLVDISVLPDYVPVYNEGEFVLTYAADCSFGQLLKSAASGAITPWVHGTDTDVSIIVGRCTQPGGVTVASNALGRAWIDV